MCIHIWQIWNDNTGNLGSGNRELPFPESRLRSQWFSLVWTTAGALKMAEIQHGWWTEARYVQLAMWPGYIFLCCLYQCHVMMMEKRVKCRGIISWKTDNLVILALMRVGGGRLQSRSTLNRPHNLQRKHMQELKTCKVSYTGKTWSWRDKIQYTAIFVPNNINTTHVQLQVHPTGSHLHSHH